VVDPVLVAESGAILLEPSAQRALKNLLLPRAAVATPNLPEAATLTALDGAEPGELARALLELGPDVVVVTGGHRRMLADVFYDGERLVDIEGERYPDGAAHGSGCTHSAVLASALAWGWEPLAAARLARRLAARAVRDGLGELGAGAGPVDVLGRAGEEPGSRH
jgi:hydroxymethylpyrimidine/phosphomethylpyrimidine kinase